MNTSVLKKAIGLILCLFIIGAIFFTGCRKQPEEIVSAGDNLTEATRNNLLLDANLLTKGLVSCMNPASTPENPDFRYMQFFTYCAGSKTTDEDFCYYGIFPLLENYNTQFAVSDCNRVIYQLFGDSKWNATTDFGTPPNGGYNEETQRYEFAIDFGWGLTCYGTGDFISSVFINDNTQIASNFELMAPDSSSGDPGWKSDGMYNIIYDVITENNETFLRFVKFEKAE